MKERIDNIKHYIGLYIINVVAASATSITFMSSRANCSKEN